MTTITLKAYPFKNDGKPGEIEISTQKDKTIIVELVRGKEKISGNLDQLFDMLMESSRNFEHSVLLHEYRKVQKRYYLNKNGDDLQKMQSLALEIDKIL